MPSSNAIVLISFAILILIKASDIPLRNLILTLNEIFKQIKFSSLFDNSKQINKRKL